VACRWENVSQMPVALGEVCAGKIGNYVYVVGESSTATLRYDVQNDRWIQTLAVRPYPGFNHACQVMNNMFYVIGGEGSYGKVQIYNPSTDMWTVTNFPTGYQGAAVCSAVIGYRIFVGGGYYMQGNTRVTSNALYSFTPSSNVWTRVSAIPNGGIHDAACGSDGIDLFIFGGNKNGVLAGPGTAAVMVYRVGSNSWGHLRDLPFAKANMGTALYAQNWFIIVGGEATVDSNPAFPSQNGVYKYIFSYHRIKNWYLESGPFGRPRTGTWPVLLNGNVTTYRPQEHKGAVSVLIPGGENRIGGQSQLYTSKITIGF